MPSIARRFVYLWVAGLVVAGCGGGSEPAAESPAPAASQVAPADLVLRGGTIATVDTVIGNVEALAVNGYRITAVGSNDEIAAYVGPDTEVVELNGRFVRR